MDEPVSVEWGADTTPRADQGYIVEGKILIIF